jgi:hypothetical protein
MAVAKESNLCNDLFHPQLLRKSRNKNNRRKLGSTEAEAVTVGNVIPSNIAFVDILLEQREIISISDCTTTSLFDVSSIQRSQACDNLLSITFTHEISYRGEPVFSSEPRVVVTAQKFVGNLLAVS